MTLPKLFRRALEMCARVEQNALDATRAFLDRDVELANTMRFHFARGFGSCYSAGFTTWIPALNCSGRCARFTAGMTALRAV